MNGRRQKHADEYNGVSKVASVVKSKLTHSEANCISVSLCQTKRGSCELGEPPLLNGSVYPHPYT